MMLAFFGILRGVHEVGWAEVLMEDVSQREVIEDLQDVLPNKASQHDAN